jgi:hypothetical protein
MQAAEINSVRSVKGCICIDKLKNNIRNKLQILSILGRMSSYRKWVEHLDRTEDERTPKQEGEEILGEQENNGHSEAKIGHWPNP